MNFGIDWLRCDHAASYDKHGRYAETLTVKPISCEIVTPDFHVQLNTHFFWI